MAILSKPPVRRSLPPGAAHPFGENGAARRAVGRNLTAYGFLCGALICFAFFSWYPMIREIILSFQENNFVDPAKWVGFDNFRTVIEDPAFRSAWLNTAAFSGLALIVGYAVPFVLAVVLNELRHAVAYLRFVVYLPVMLPPAVAVLLFKWFYDPGSGLFNQILDVFGIPPLAWLDSTSTALISLVLVSTWMNLGTGTLIYLAALQSIPGDLYESAELDGAGLFRRVWHVTVPQTKLILLVMLLAYLMYQYAFNFGDFGGGSALGLMLMIVLLVFSTIYLRVSREEDAR